MHAKLWLAVLGALASASCGSEQPVETMRIPAHAHVALVGDSDLLFVDSFRDEETEGIEVTRADRDGKPRWLSAWGLPPGQQGEPILVDASPDGSAAVVVDDNPRQLTENIDPWVVRFETSGTPTWATRLKPLGDGAIQVADVAVDAEGRVFVSGSAARGLAIGDTEVIPSLEEGVAVDFVLAFDATGALLWHRELGTGGGPKLHLEWSGSLLLLGSSKVARLSADGERLEDLAWDATMGTPIAVDGEGRFYARDYVGGWLRGYSAELEERWEVGGLKKVVAVAIGRRGELAAGEDRNNVDTGKPYVDDDHVVFKVDTDGNRRWTQPTLLYLDASVLVENDGAVLVDESDTLVRYEDAR